MKLSEIKATCIDIREMFEATAPINWSIDGDVQVGEFVLGGFIFHILLQPGFFTLPDNSHTYTFLNIAFSRVVDGKDSFELTGGGPFTSKVLGIVRNGILQKVDLMNDYDAAIFVARDNQEKRMSIYNKLAQVWMKDFGSIIKNIQTATGPVITIIMKHTNDPNSKPFFDYLKSHKKY